MQTSVQYTFHDQGQEREGEVAQVRLLGHEQICYCK